MSYKHLTSDIDRLRHLIRAYDGCNENFLQRLSYSELLRIGEAWMTCGWDIAPDRWTRGQLTDAVRYGIAPTWRDEGEALYTLTPRTYEATHEDIAALVAMQQGS